MPRRNPLDNDVVSVSSAIQKLSSYHPLPILISTIDSICYEQRDSLGSAGEEENSPTRRNPRRGKHVVYKQPPGLAVGEDDEDVEMEEEDFENAEEEEDSEPLIGDSDEEEPRHPKRGAKRKSPRNDESKASPPRKSSRSNKFSSSMAEPSDSSGLIMEKIMTDADDDGEDEGRKKATSSRRRTQLKSPESPHKSPARRHAQKRRSMQMDAESSSDTDSADDESEVDDEEEQEPLRIQRIIATRTERKGKWREICAKINTTEIDNGSRWFQKPVVDPEADQTFEERFLIKWADLSYLHCSWETRKDLIDQVEGAQTYFSTFFRKSRDGYLFSPDERNDGDYFDPAFTQIHRILEVEWNGDVKAWPADKESSATPEDAGIVMDKKDEDGTGRQFLIKWGNTPYSEATYEFERDLIWNDVDYKSQVEAYLRRNAKPSRKARKEAQARGKEELKKLYNVFSEKANRSEEEHQNTVKEYQEELQQLKFKNGGQLRDYQAEGISWMLSNYVNDRSSILADGTSWIFTFIFALYR